MDNAGHAAFETLKAIEKALQQVAESGAYVSGNYLASVLLNAIREARGEGAEGKQSLTE